MKVTEEMLEAASRRVGWDVSEEEVFDALARHDGVPTDELRGALERKVDAFDAGQCRDAVLAADIELLRIAIAARLAEETA